ncbi:MAG: YdcF family protein [bacterium]|nr:YdcF family protein [bacterium]
MMSTAVLAVFAGCLAATLWFRLIPQSGNRFWKLFAIAAAMLGIAFLAVTEPFEIRKVVAACVMPVGLIWIVLSAVGILAAKVADRRVTACVWSVWIAFTVGGNAVVGGAMAGFLESKWTRVDPMASHTFDAVLVLGGGVARHHHGQVYVGSSGDRAMLGARLYLAGLADRLVTTGPVYRVGDQPFPTVPELTAQIWQDLGIPSEAIVNINGPRATKEEIAEFAVVVEEEDWQRVAVVSSAIHLRRVERHCRRLGLDATLLPANFLSTQHPMRPRDLVPRSEGFRLIEAAMWEIVGQLAGR